MSFVSVRELSDIVYPRRLFVRHHTSESHYYYYGEEIVVNSKNKTIAVILRFVQQLNRQWRSQ